MGKSNISQFVGVQIRNEIVAELETRAANLSLRGRGTYAALVFEWWASQGFPAVTPSDQAMQDLKALRVADQKQAEYKAPKKSA